MRTIVGAAAAVALFITAAPAAAQNDQSGSITATAREVYNSCLSISRKQGGGNGSEGCACVTGYMGGMMSDRDFEVASVLLRVGEMSEEGAAQSDIDAEVRAFIQRGFTEEDVRRVAAMVQAAGARGDAVCAQFGQPSV